MSLLDPSRAQMVGKLFPKIFLPHTWRLQQVYKQNNRTEILLVVDVYLRWQRSRSEKEIPANNKEYILPDASFGKCTYRAIPECLRWLYYVCHSGEWVDLLWCAPGLLSTYNKYIKLNNNGEKHEHRRKKKCIERRTMSQSSIETTTH